MTHGSEPSSVAAQAARWFAARRRKLATLEEREAYRRWSQDAANQAALRKVDGLWADLGRVYSVEETRETIRPLRKTAIALGCIAVTTLGLMCCIGGPFWTALDWTTR